MSLRNIQITQIGGLKEKDLTQLWKLNFRSDPPSRIGIELRSALLANGIQERRLGISLRTLDRKFVEASSPNCNKHERRVTERIGSRLIRGWGGVNHEVTVLHKGFSYRGSVYRSLSEIARLITGARWSGPRFFGLSSKKAP